MNPRLQPNPVSPATLALHYDLLGSGEPVLVLPGFGCANWIFKDAATKLGGRYRFVLPDHRGMGASQHAPGPYTIADMAADALRLMDELGYQRFHVIGISMGGFVAQSLCLQARNRVQRLILMCTTSSGPDFLPLTPFTETQLREAFAMTPTDMISQSMAATVHPTFRARDPQRFDRLYQLRLSHRADCEQAVLQLKAANAFLDTPMPISEIHCPALALTGTEDRFVPPENAAILADILPQGQFQLIPESDHWFFWEREDETCEKITAFLG